MKWSQLNPYHARQFEIAITGRIPIAFYGSFDNLDTLVDVARSFKLAFGVFEPCKCGGFGHARRSCYCSQDELSAWRHSSALKLMSAFPIVAKPQPKRENFETVNALLNRLQGYERFKPEKSSQYGDDGIRLLTAWINQTGASDEEIGMIEQVAETIDQMNGKEGYSVAALAEAMQYRSTSLI